MTASTPMPTVFIPHGGGPCFFMQDPPGLEGMWDKMASYLKGIRASLPRQPKAILVISAHWETNVPTVMTAPKPGMLFDYYGFPAHTYELSYPAPGSPELAQRVKELLQQDGFPVAEDSSRGFDHGVFIPFLLMFPEADIPVIQLSMQQNLDPATHLKMGKALEALRHEDVLIVGSGLSFHNLRIFFSGGQADPASAAFHEWLGQSVTADAQTREAQLSQWSKAPGARHCHPREEHLLPLMVVAGAAGNDAGVVSYQDRIIGKSVGGYHFGA
ncbi:DODA-type extradiol aromatic ring-opening family dioxygenase [Pokkaliibacter sp. CJK22405]|uniref:DODA-type extradiol aromatic ring-opening family dioxygenase n=1 Tax=Pokkaliibacter sp. CJK22405 TaxID=3384615 RepID=UPI0039851EAB